MVEIKRVRYEDELDQLVWLLKRVFRAESSRKSWTWRYVNNPLAANLPELIVATDKGKIVGARPYMLNEIWVGGEKLLAAQHCDTMVDPDYRRHGIFNRMGEQGKSYLAEHGCQLSFGFPGPMSRRGFAKQGYSKLVDTAIYFRPITSIDRVRCLVEKTRLVLKDSQKILSDAAVIDRFEIQIYDQYHPAVAEIEARRDPGIIDLVRSESYLRWRFEEHRSINYKYLVASRNGQPLGFAIISKRNLAPALNVGLVVDYQIVDSEAACFAALVSKAFDEFTRMGCNLVAMLAHDDRRIKQALVERLRFRCTSRRPYKWLRDFGYMDILKIDDALSLPIDIFDSANWRVTYGYLNYT